MTGKYNPLLHIKNKIIQPTYLPSAILPIASACIIASYSSTGCTSPGEVVDSFTGDTSVLGDGLNLLGSSNADFLESYRKSYLKAEILDFLEFLLGGALQYELNKRAERNAAAVICVLYSEGGNAVVERVSSRTVHVIRTDARKVNVSLNDIFKRWSNGVYLGRPQQPACRIHGACRSKDVQAPDRPL